MAKKAARKSRKAAGATKKLAAARTRTAAAVNGEELTWTHSKFALWSGRWEDPNDAGPTATLLHHPTAPFPDKPLIVESIDDASAEKNIQKLALDYLRQVKDLADLDYPPLQGVDHEGQWLDQLKLDRDVQNPSFAWLPIGWPS